MSQEFFPADMILLKSSEPKGVCYVETKNLDGETNLKHKTTEKYLNWAFNRDNSLESSLGSWVICEPPNDLIYKFEATMFMTGIKRKKISLSSDNILLRGSSLQNT
jgi:phospholipid-transporting ATPase